jgi:hypothetical protein
MTQELGVKSDWVRVKGSARRWVNTKTGKTISREKYDTTFGRLAGTGLNFKRAAKLRKEKNPLASSAAPKKGKKQPEEIKQFLKELKRNTKVTKDGTGRYTYLDIPEYTEYVIAAALVAISLLPGLVAYRRSLTIDANGTEISTSSPYLAPPKRVEKILKEIETLEEELNNYKFGEEATFVSIKYYVRLSL